MVLPEGEVRALDAAPLAPESLPASLPSSNPNRQSPGGRGGTRVCAKHVSISAASGFAGLFGRMAKLHIFLILFIFIDKIYNKKVQK